MADQNHITEVASGILLAALSWITWAGKRKRNEIDERLLRHEEQLGECVPRDEFQGVVDSLRAEMHAARRENAEGIRGIHKRLDDLMLHLAKGKE